MGKPYSIENVEGARFDLLSPVMLCGSMFGLPLRRHRYFEIYPFPCCLLPPCDHSRKIVYISGNQKLKNERRRDAPAWLKREALQTPWMSIKGMDEAIPPAYTEWVGKQLIQ